MIECCFWQACMEIDGSTCGSATAMFLKIGLMLCKIFQSDKKSDLNKVFTYPCTYLVGGIQIEATNSVKSIIPLLLRSHSRNTLLASLLELKACGYAWLYISKNCFWFSPCNKKQTFNLQHFFNEFAASFGKTEFLHIPKICWTVKIISQHLTWIWPT